MSFNPPCPGGGGVGGYFTIGKTGCAPVLGSFWPENSGTVIYFSWKISVIGVYSHWEFSGIVVCCYTENSGIRC